MRKNNPQNNGIPLTDGHLQTTLCTQHQHKDGVGVIAIHGLSREQWNKLCRSVNQNQHE